MKIKSLHTVYFLGVGGIGMSAIARYFLAMGCQVLGYDKTKTELTEQLEKEGIAIHYEEDIELVEGLLTSFKKEESLVVYTPAIPQEHKEYQFLTKNGVKLYKRSEVLGIISQNYFTIAIAGTHGKTTTSSIIAHVLNECGVDCIAFLGGISLNFNSNLLLNKKAKTMVVEADEYDRSFLTLSPDIALITSLDADHLDVYGDKEEMKNSYQEFVKKIKKEGVLITKKELVDDLHVNSEIQYKSYSIADQAAYHATAVEIKGGDYFVDVKSDERLIENIKIGLPGIHNVENSIGAFAIADKMGVDNDKIKNALASYKGVKRRFEYHIKTPSQVYVDDYAHHPKELEVCIQSIKDLYPNKRVTGIFQPHLYTRTRDFVDEFAASLSLLDELILLDIYPARELPIEGVTSEIIYEKVTIDKKIVLKKEELMPYLSGKKYEVLLTLGAGDIDVFIRPIKAMLEN